MAQNLIVSGTILRTASQVNIAIFWLNIFNGSDINRFWCPAYLFSSGRSQLTGSGRVWFYRAEAAARPAEARAEASGAASREANKRETTR